jgi:glycine cleavage system aminomethyltransferase T
METLDLEAGIPRPFLDYIPAASGDARDPRPEHYGLESLIDKNSTHYNGREKRPGESAPPLWKLMGVELESDRAAPHTPLIVSDQTVGRTLSSRYSPTLRRAIALAQISPKVTSAGSVVTLVLPPSLDAPELRSVSARIVDLPFLPQADSMAS